MSDIKNLYNDLVNFYNVNDENFKEFMAKLYEEMLANHRDVKYVKEHLLKEEIVKKLDEYLTNGNFNINIQQKVEEFINNSDVINDINTTINDMNTSINNSISNINTDIEDLNSQLNTVDEKIKVEGNKKVNKTGDNISGNLTFNNNTGVKGKLTDGTVGNIAVLNTDNEVIVGTTSGQIKDVILASYNKERPLFMNQDLQRRELMLLNDRYVQQKLLSKFLVKLENNDNIKIICVGDSLTYGQNTSESTKRPANSDTTLDPNSPIGYEQAKTTYPEYLKHLFGNYYGSNKSVGATIVNRGVCGQTAQWSYQQWAPHKTTGDVAIICLGNNDSTKNVSPDEYISYLEKIILKYQSWDIPSILMVPPRMKTTSEDKFRGYKNAMRNLGTAYGLPVIDGSQFHFGYQSTDIFDSDLVHFSELGYKIIANRVFSALLQLTKKNVVRDKTMVYPYSDRNAYYKKGSAWEQVAGNGVVLNNTNGNSMAIVIGAGGKVTFPIYTEEMLAFIPIFTKSGTGKVKIHVNTGIQQNKQLYKIESDVFKTLTNFITPSSLYEYTGNNFTVDINNSYWNNSKLGVNDEKGIPYLTSIGYNTITFENAGTDNVVLQGVYFHNVN